MRLITILCCVLLLFVLNSNSHAATVFVNGTAAGLNDGSTWANAFTDLQDALDTATPADEIWVAQGTYFPTAPPDGTSVNLRDRSFHWNTDLKIYGGFDGTETTLAARNAAVNETILSGDFNGDDAVAGEGHTLVLSNNTENAFHVTVVAFVGNAAILDGFTISGGNATGSNNLSAVGYGNIDRRRGGGQICRNADMTISNCIFKHNQGYR